MMRSSTFGGVRERTPCAGCWRSLRSCVHARSLARLACNLADAASRVARACKNAAHAHSSSERHSRKHPGFQHHRPHSIARLAGQRHAAARGRQKRRGNEAGTPGARGTRATAARPGRQGPSERGQDPSEMALLSSRLACSRHTTVASHRAAPIPSRSVLVRLYYRRYIGYI